MVAVPSDSLVGRRFFLLTVISQLKSEKYPKYECLCDCGKFAIKFKAGLLKSTSVSCGCMSYNDIIYNITDKGRICAACKEWKSWNKFSGWAKGPRGRKNSCKDCIEFSRIQAVYSISKEEYFWLLDLQDNVCALCGQKERKKNNRLSIDHDHSCCRKGKACKKCIRGLLCDFCNGRLVSYVENNERLRFRFLDYLERRPFVGVG